MKKIQLTGLALATLAACAPAWAQSTVTIYGAVDVAVGKAYQLENNQIRAGKTGLQSSSMVNLQDSFVGFKGVEDLGGGLQVGFQLEQGLDASSGSADPEGAFARGANIWLGGSWGRIKLGRAATPSYNAMASWDLVGAGNNSLAYNAYGPVGYTGGKRQSNQVSYQAPSIGGFSVEMAYVPKDDNNFSGLNRSRFDVGATYNFSALTLGAAYNKVSGLDASYAFGAKYQYQNYEFAGGYFHSRNANYFDDATGVLVANAVASADGFTVGAKGRWGKYVVGVDLARDTKSEYVIGGARYDSKKYTYATLHGIYEFSKRTKAYVNYSRWSGINNYGIGISHGF